MILYRDDIMSAVINVTAAFYITGGATAHKCALFQYEVKMLVLIIYKNLFSGYWSGRKSVANWHTL